MTIQGKLHVKRETQQVSEKFRKREFVIEYVENPMYPQYLLFQLVQDKVDYLDKFEVGQQVSVDFNLRGRPWTNAQNETKFFNSLEAWRLASAPAVENAAVVPPAPKAEPIPVTESSGDDLPF